MIEPLSVDEAFLDVTGVRRLFGDGPTVARRIKDAVKTGTGLTASVGVAPNKFLAKLASDLEKPDGLTVVPTTRHGIVAFLAPLPIGRIWGVGGVTQQALEQHGIHAIGDLQNLPEQALARLVGKHGAAHLRRLAFGEDERQVSPDRDDEKSISREHTFSRDCADPDVLETTLRALVEDVGGRLRADGRYAGLARLKLRWQDFKTITRQRPVKPPCCDDFSLRTAAFELFRAEKLVTSVRLIGFGVSDLRNEPEAQLSLFGENDRERHERLSRTVDRIRNRFGDTSIGRA
jgi:nucleotidyltransferase/DNA polymerase involved in DNA repair